MAMETDSDEVEKVLQRLANESSSSSFHTDDDDYNGSKVEELLRQIEQEKDTTDSGSSNNDQHNVDTSMSSGGGFGGSSSFGGGIGAPSSYDGEGEGDGDVVVVAKPPVARAKKPNGKLGDKPAAPRKKSPPRDEIPKPWKKKGAIRKRADDNDDIFMISAKDPPPVPTLQDTPIIGDDEASTALTSPSETSRTEFAPSSTLSRTPPESPSTAARAQTTSNGIPHDNEELLSPQEKPSSPFHEPPTSSTPTPPPSSPTPPSNNTATASQPVYNTPPKQQQTDSLPIRQATPPQTAIPTHSSTPARSSPRSTPTPPPASHTPPPRTESPLPQQESQPTPPTKQRKKPQAAPEDVMIDDAVADETPVFSKNDFAVLKTQILKQMTEETAILAQEFQELKTKYDEEIRGKSRLKAVLNDYEKTIAKLIDDASSGHHEGVSDRIVELENDNKRKTEEYDAIFSAHAELKSRYESAKADNEKLKSNEQVQKEAISKLQNELQGSETRFRALQTHAESKLDTASEQLVKLRDERAKEVAALQARMQKAEARTAALEKENKELLAIADDLMGKIEKHQ